jgi:hypothetical protein
MGPSRLEGANVGGGPIFPWLGGEAVVYMNSLWTYFYEIQDFFIGGFNPNPRVPPILVLPLLSSRI